MDTLDYSALDFRGMEIAKFRSWPALEEEDGIAIVLRFSNGYTKRANSANVLTVQ
jgi:N-acetylglutamate synthase